ncbi:MAG: hypothetical protein ACREXY_11110 [Gammaproteobacteria bacterium]
MAHTVRKMDYCYLTIASRAGQGGKILKILKEAGVNLLALSAFPCGQGLAQFDLMPEKMADLTKVAKLNKWKVSNPRKGFLVQGDDEVGAALAPLAKLADKKINVTAGNAISTGNGRFGMVFWVKPKDYQSAAKILGAK